MYVADGPAEALADWGDPVATFEPGDGSTARSELEGEAEGAAVLLWFTRAGDNGQMVVEDVRLER